MTRQKDVAIGFRFFRPLATLIGGMVATIIGGRADQRERKRTEDQRYDYRCPFCNEKFDTALEVRAHRKGKCELRGFKTP